MTVFDPITPATLHWQGTEPRSSQFDDVYYASTAGSEESQHVFIQHNNLPNRFAALPAQALYVIAETGFGTGLNFLEAARCFLDKAPTSARLSFISCEKHPLTRQDLIQSHQPFKQHQQLARALQAIYPPATPGFHLLNIHPQIDLLLLYGDANQLLPLCHAKVDSWFLDGFAPAKNADLWQIPLYQHMAKLSRPGASVATFTAAGHVKRGLQQCGFEVAKRPGFGHKRDMLAGRFSGIWQPFLLKYPAVAIVGAGLAGCTTAHALANAGCQVTLFDPLGIAQAASGNLTGAVYTTPSSHFSPQNRFYQSSYLRALAWFKRNHWPALAEQGALNGLIQIAAVERQIDKHQNALQSGYWPSDVMSVYPDHPHAVCYPGGGYLNPPRWCQHLIAHPNIQHRPFKVTALQHTPQQTQPWQISVKDNADLYRADVVILANAQQAQQLLNTALPIRCFKGQVTHVKATDASLAYRQTISHQGYFVPALNGVHTLGASFEQDDGTLTPDPQRDMDNIRLLKQWLPDIWQALGGDQITVTASRVSVRCQGQHYLPLAGQLNAGLYLNIAHGSRGLTATPLIADLLTSLIMQTPMPVDAAIYQALQPASNNAKTGNRLVDNTTAV